MRMAQLALLALTPSLLLAQGTEPQATLEPSAHVRCLMPEPAERGLPAYPLEAWKAGRAGNVKVELAFSSPTRGPEIRVLEDDPDESFAESVREHVRRLRVPCLLADEAPARVTISYAFRPALRQVAYSDAVDADDARRQAMMGCVRHVHGSMMPAYPSVARRDEVFGRVIARMRFTSAEAPPEVEVFAQRRARPLARAIESWASGYRMPCHAGQPVVGVWTFVFRFVGDGPFGFRPLTLVQLMPAVRGISRQRLSFDTHEMACPFDLRLVYRRPFLRNEVHQFGSAHPARRELIEWLRQAELDLDGQALDAIFGDETVVTVPCVRVDLKPKE